MEEILLSVIIPVYKSEKYLDDCINSIVKTHYFNFEIILINDGSPDNCPQMCDEWVKKDKRIKVIHQKNSGPSQARNNGIEASRGKYITFVDSDDKLVENSIDLLIDYLKNKEHTFELCFMSISKFYENGEILHNSDIKQCFIKNKTKLEVAKYLSTRKKFPGSPCSKIYLKEFLLKNKILFPNDRRLAEDLGFVLDCIIHADKCDALDFDYYLYRQQENVTRSNVINENLINGVRKFVDESINKLTQNNKPKNALCKYYLSFIAYEYQILLYFYEKIKLNDKGYLKNNKWVLKYSNNLNGRVIFLLSKILGLRLTSKIIKKIKG